jgi:acyl carrier protein
MDDVQARLAKCFLAIFPDLKPDEIVHSTPESIMVWDSVATVTLVTLVEEEFGLQIDLEDLDQFTSFENLQKYLQKCLHANEDGTQG